ncbi:MAG: phenylalanine--tRNA ligase subunit beta [Gammaproteobacteria bacterium]|nr:MAG: phenylalanine--tRNA ligase subunit beta [Gammaproteobacteria bacterium]
MKFSEKWLREWVDPPVSTETLAEQLTLAGLEVDSIEPAAGAFSGVVVGRVLEVVQHPNADKLRVCKVDVGENAPLQIVCGAPNVAPGMKAPTARIGAQVGEMKIRKAKLRGVESFGMLCSARELGLSEDHSGLMALPEEAPVGEDLRAWLGLDDHLIEIDLTPNRGDCLSIAGIAREVGVLNRCPVRRPPMPEVPPTRTDTFPIEIADPAGCPRYLGRVLRGVNAGADTPLWMQEKLRRCGLRSLGPLVDVTNYVMLELGQPMHAFDLDTLRGGIQVRRARAGERLVLLDGREIALDPEVLVIADATGPLALAGIMGGADSGVRDQTRNLFLECAFFTPEVVAGRARRFGLQTDSSYRFERGVDPELQRLAMERATHLLLEICGGEAGPVIERVAGEFLPERAAIHLRMPRMVRLLGFEPERDDVEEILGRLGCTLEALPDGWRVVPPSFRFDLRLEADLVEEVARIHGYDRLPRRLPEARMVLHPRPETEVPLARLRDALADLGYREAVTYSFIDPELARRIVPQDDPVRLTNPLSAEMSVMRTSLWPGLLHAARHNLNRQQERVYLFELGLNFIRQQNEIKQEMYLGGLACGIPEGVHWSGSGRRADFHDVKGDVEHLLELTGRAGDFAFEAAVHPALHPGRSARILDRGHPVGWLGTLHPRLAQVLDLPEDVQLFEVQAEALRQARVPAFTPLSRYPSIRRDLALLLAEDTPAEAVLAVVREAAGPLLQSVFPFDVYRGEGVEKGRKSMALGLILQDPSRTLTDEDVASVLQDVLTALRERLGATIRG